MSQPTPPTVALIGATGYGVQHREAIAALERAGRVRLVALCDTRPLPEEATGAVAVHTDHRAMLAAARPDIVVVSTPPHTHLPIALDVVAAGADLLLEKPPVTSLADHDLLTRALRDAGRICQVGFQAQGSHALAALRDAIRDGRLGKVTGIAAAGTWIRDDAYYDRSPWAGRRSVDGQPVVDGALVNPFAHTLMLGLDLVRAAAPGAVPTRFTLERYRTREIEVEDTACLRVEFSAGPPLLIAVTLSAAGFREGDMLVHGTDGSAVLEYPTDRLLFGPDSATVPGAAAGLASGERTGLLANLLDHRRDPSVALLAPLDATRDFTALVEAILTAPAPAPVPAEHRHQQHDTGSPAWVIDGVDAAVTAAATTMTTYADLGLPWTTTPYAGTLPVAKPN
ncbi:Gfo/Idh/MocA family oxidoreductase [Micromonospora sp. NPDC049523]|uniref:Gfo/Idh/MocA family protein n=1 Tax=Micromonospora sp. NPDC049523 TaxID=3155921 RepID=UPI003422D4E8